MVFSKEELRESLKNKISEEIINKSKAAGVRIEVFAKVVSVNEQNEELSGTFTIPLDLSEEILNQCKSEIENALLHDLEESN